MIDSGKQIEQLKNAIYWIIVTIVIISVSFAYILLKNSQSLYEKDLKISTLISEVGSVKELVDLKNTSINILYGKINLIHGYIKEINEKLLEATKNQQYDLNNISTDLNLARAELDKLIKEKENLEKELNQKKNTLHQSSPEIVYSPYIIDILLLGQHKQLVDTLIIVNVNPLNKTITLTSLPRDLYFEGRKINELYSKYGIVEVQKAVYNITGVAFEKYVVLDLQSFIDIVDMLGGIEVSVEKELLDNAYPGENYSYKTVSFSPGLTHMNGETALQYARSRKSTSDFDRSYRQQQVIESVMNKAEQKEILLNLDYALKMYATVSNNIKTNINIFEALSYLQSYKDYRIKGGNVISTSNFLYSTANSVGQYILLPNTGDYDEIKEFFYELINS